MEWSSWFWNRKHSTCRIFGEFGQNVIAKTRKFSSASSQFRVLHKNENLELKKPGFTVDQNALEKSLSFSNSEFSFLHHTKNENSEFDQTSLEKTKVFIFEFSVLGIVQNRKLGVETFSEVSKSFQNSEFTTSPTQRLGFAEKTSDFDQDVS